MASSPTLGPSQERPSMSPKPSDLAFFISQARLPPSVAASARSASLISQSTQRSQTILFADTCGGPKPRPLVRKGTSPPPIRRFQDHVSFDTFSKEEPTDKNPISFTLNSKHSGYQYKRRSRTFMVGLGENDYSDYALQWMLEELVDDGDEIICLRVIDKDSKTVNDRSLESKLYQDEARQLMESIKSKNDENRAISITLEFAIGKLHPTFQHMFQIYEPAMLIVGTRGRSLGGFQGLVGRNSFSKWCLQYSPIPVVVVRPSEKREKKKLKRTNDPTRRSYIQILQDSGHELHEVNTSSSNSTYEASMLPSKDADGEAHAVAVALELPAKFDPTLKAYAPDGLLSLHRKNSSRSDVTDVSNLSLEEHLPESQPPSPGVVIASPRSRLDSPDVSDVEYSEDDDGGEEFEAVSGDHLLDNMEIGVVDKAKKEVAKEKMDKLHAMEQGEAKALALGRRKGSVDSEDSGNDG